MPAWIGNAGIDRKAMRVILGNPLIAITMLRHDVTAGLFAPVEVLLLDEGAGRSSLTYVKPSSLMVVEPITPSCSVPPSNSTRSWPRWSPR